MKISFKNDYSEGAHINILQALVNYNEDQQPGYGEDFYSLQAKENIKQQLKSEQSEIFFVSGGTQANLIVISALLKPYQAVISASSGHILNNETGAIEAAGHKVLGIQTADGKLRPEDIIPVLEGHKNVPHQVMPKLVYISNSTELGTIYQLEELKALSDFCKAQNLILFLDGARLAQALTSEINDIKFEQLADLTDVFYIGGTKNGALLGEGIVLNNPNLQDDFAFNIKQKGALLAKGRVLGIQFLELFKENLYFELGKKANVQAMKIKNFLVKKGVKFLSDTSTNQIFPILENTVIEKLSEDFEFYVWQKVDENFSAIRLITSWNTKDSATDCFLESLDKIF